MKLCSEANLPYVLRSEAGPPITKRAKVRRKAGRGVTLFATCRICGGVRSSESPLNSCSYIPIILKSCADRLALDTFDSLHSNLITIDAYTHEELYFNTFTSDLQPLKFVIITKPTIPQLIY